ncbi:MAG: GAF domain-containing sensor histidine kinase [Chloroflexota bacterium]|nr:GAF domain-containing sensor histidine kinase [Chloroflexota bacterium]
MLRDDGGSRFSPAEPSGDGVDQENLQGTTHRLLVTLERLLEVQPTSLRLAMDEAATLIAEVLGTDKVDAFLHESETDTLVAVGASRTPMGLKQRSIGLDRQALANGGRAVEVFQTGQPHLNGRVHEDANELIGVRRGLGVRSQMGVPLDVAGTRRGTLMAQSTQVAFFSQQDLRFLQAVSRWVGSVVHRAELTEHTALAVLEQGRRLAAEELITVLAHDLRNYLVPIRARVEMLNRRAVREQHGANLQDTTKLHQAVDRLARMISELMDVARLEQGLFTLSPQPLDLAALAHEVAADLATPGGAPIRVETVSELELMADPGRVRQALENLLANAEQHSRGDATLLDVAPEDRDGQSWAVITVKDHGPGIAPDVLPQLFKRFSKGTGSDGLGLGLHLAQQIAMAHGGTLEVSSTLGKGTTFRLSLPTECPRR